MKPLFIIAFGVICTFLLLATSIMMIDRSWIVLAYPVGIVLIVMCFVWPEAMLMFLVALIPLDVFAVLPAQSKVMTLYKFLFPLIVLAMLLRHAAGNHRRIEFNAMDKWLGIWAGYNILLVAVSVDRFVAIDAVRRLISMWLFYFVLSRALVDPRRPRVLAWVVIASVTISVLIGLSSFVHGSNPFSHYQDRHLVRLTGAADISPNDYAIMILFPLALALFCMMESRGPARLFHTASIPVLMAGVVLTYSRSAFLTLVATLVFFLFLVRRRITPLWGTLILMGCVMVPLAVPASYWARLKTLFSDRGEKAQDVSLLQRANYLKVGWRIIKTYPVLGCGPGNFPVLHARAGYQTLPSLIGVERLAHNAYLTVATETGAVGVVIFWVGFMGSALVTALVVARRVRPGDSMGQALLVSLFAFLVMGTFLHLDLNKYFWVILACIRASWQREVA